MAVVVVAVGGAVGAGLREIVTLTFPTPSAQFPWSTFSVNVAGSFLLALLPAFAVVRRRPLLPPLIGTGVLGGFTTFSAYSEQTRTLYVAGQQQAAGAYVLSTLACCLVAVALASRLSDRASRDEFDAEEGDL
ncbi:MAG: fluoride efflux transporter FluC [Nocardioides sp.]